MKLLTRYYFMIPLLIFSFACNNGAKNHKEYKAVAEASDSAQTRSVSSSAAVEKNKDPERKFIRTADLKFKVKDVAKTTYAIEDITNKFGGFVTSTTLQSVVNNKTSVAVSVDSNLETTYYTVENSMTLRVPNTKLDTTLKCVALLVSFLDSRIIKADDIGLQLLSNDLTVNRVMKNGQRVTNAIDTRGKKLNETTSAEDVVMDRQEQADKAKISSLSLMDQVKFSTVNLSIYQRESIKRELIKNDANIKSYEPGFFIQIWESIKTGLNVLEILIVELVKLWWLITLAITGYILYRKFIKPGKS